MKELTIRCDCYSPEHHIFVTDFEDEEEHGFYMLARLNPIRPWYKRIVIGFNYILGRPHKYEYSEVFIEYGGDSARKLKNFLNEKVVD